VYRTVASFSLDPATAHDDVLFSNDNMTATSSSFDNRVVLGSVGLSRGVHYWELAIDRYENNKDPAFGITTRDVPRDRMIGNIGYQWRSKALRGPGSTVIWGPPFPSPPLPSPSLPLSPSFPAQPLPPAAKRPPNPANGVWGSAVSSPSPSRNRIWCILALKSVIWWQQF